MPKSKRKIDLEPSTLAKRLTKMADKSSAEVVEKLASIYQWTPEERRSKTNVVRGMRAAQQELCSRIRQHLPFSSSPRKKDEFLSWLESAVEEVEERDSDEFV